MLPIRTDNTHWPTKVIRNHFKSVSLGAMFDLLHGPFGMRAVPLLIGAINVGLGRWFRSSDIQSLDLSALRILNYVYEFQARLF